MRRDWPYRHAILNQAWLPVLCIAGIVLSIVSGHIPSSPLSRDMSLAHFVPQLLGLAVMALCANLAITAFYDGSWIYLTAPITNLSSFARGVYWGVWVPAVGLPYLVMLPFMIRFWGWREAALLAGFSVTVLSLYLGLQMSLITGVPFSGKPNELRNVLNATYIQFCWLGAVLLPAILQWNLFRSWRLALGSGGVLLVLTCVIVHWRLRELAGLLRWRLYELKMGTRQMFKELE